MKIQKLLYIVLPFSILTLNSCQNKKLDNNEIELFSNDYNIIMYYEHEIDSGTEISLNVKRIQKELSIKIINSDKIKILENAINPIIYLNFNNQRYLTKGQLNLLSSIPDGCDYFFFTDENGKISFFEDKILFLLGFEERRK